MPAGVLGPSPYDSRPRGWDGFRRGANGVLRAGGSRQTHGYGAGGEIRASGVPRGVRAGGLKPARLGSREVPSSQLHPLGTTAHCLPTTLCRSLRRFVVEVRRAAANCDGPSSTYDEPSQLATRHRCGTTGRRNLRRDIVTVRRSVATCDETSLRYDGPSQLATRHRCGTTGRRNLRRDIVTVRRSVATCDETSLRYDGPSQLATRHRCGTTVRRNLRRDIVAVRRAVATCDEASSRSRLEWHALGEGFTALSPGGSGDCGSHQSATTPNAAPLRAYRRGREHRVMRSYWRFLLFLLLWTTSCWLVIGG